MPEAAQEPGLPLCDAQALAEGGKAFTFGVLQYGRPVAAFVLRHEGRLVGYLNRCVHVPVEMDWQAGEFLDAERRYIVCSIHGATYAPQDGRCVAGPCGRGRLTPVEVREIDGRVYWYPSRDIRPALPPAAPALEAEPAQKDPHDPR